MSPRETETAIFCARTNTPSYLRKKPLAQKFWAMARHAARVDFRMPKLNPHARHNGFGARGLRVGMHRFHHQRHHTGACTGRALS